MCFKKHTHSNSRDTGPRMCNYVQHNTISFRDCGIQVADLRRLERQKEVKEELVKQRARKKKRGEELKRLEKEAIEKKRLEDEVRLF